MTIRLMAKSLLTFKSLASIRLNPYSPLDKLGRWLSVAATCQDRAYETGDCSGGDVVWRLTHSLQGRWDTSYRQSLLGPQRELAQLELLLSRLCWLLQMPAMVRSLTEVKIDRS